MHENNWTLFQAMGHVKSKRSVIFPNPGFQRQLLDYEKKLINTRRNTTLIAESMPEHHKLFLQTNSPLAFLQKSLSESHHNGGQLAHRCLKTQTKETFKPRYKNIRDAYDEFKTLKRRDTNAEKESEGGT